MAAMDEALFLRWGQYLAKKREETVEVMGSMRGLFRF